MIVGTVVTFSGDSGEHADKNEKDCTGRHFRVTAAGTGAVNTGYVQCTVCFKELAAWERGLLQPESEYNVESHE